MRIGFIIPEEAQRVGGLDTAIQTLRQALEGKGHEVTLNAPPSGHDLVHFHGLWLRRAPADAQLGRAEGIPYIVSPHGMLEPWAWRHKWWKKWPYYWLIEKQFLNQAGALLATSRLEASNLRRFHLRPPIKEIPLGLPAQIGPDYAAARFRLNWAAGEFIILYLSRLHQKKGLHLLIEALAQATRMPNSIRLFVVGDGEPEYRRQIEQLIVRHRARLPEITFAGAVWGMEKWDYLRGADLFCLPTHSENFGLAILEACQVGTPVLTTVHTPWKIFLEEHALPVVEPTVNDLVPALEKLAGMRWETTQRSTLATATSAVFGWDQLTDHYIDCYSSVIRGG